MNSEESSEPIKVCSWLDFLHFEIPLEVLTAPDSAVKHIDNINIKLLTDRFELLIVKTYGPFIKLVIFRDRLNPNEKLDDGCALIFYFTAIGFDEETQSAVMKHDEEKAGVTLALTESVLKKVAKTHFVFDILVVVKMLEFKSLDESDPRKINVEKYISFAKSKLQKEESEKLGCILNNPELKDVFTGRLPLAFFRRVMFCIAIMAKNFTKLAKYFKVKYDDKDAQLPDFDVSQVLVYVGLYYKDEPITIFQALEAYFMAQRLGLDCLKIAAVDYLVHVMDEGFNVLEVLSTAIVAHDEDLFELAAVSFLSRYSEIIRSPEFESFSARRGFVTRLMFHSLRIWIFYDDIFIPEWNLTTEQITEPTTEL